jgi:GGDEF domain-containing protein
MTGLYNRSVLASDLPRLVTADGEAMVAVYAIDLDHFKRRTTCSVIPSAMRCSSR